MRAHPQFEFGQHGVRQQRDRDDTHRQKQCRNGAGRIDPDDASCRGDHFADQAHEASGQRRDLTSTNGGVLVSEGQSTSVGRGTHGFNFVTDPIPPGGHTATMRWSDNVLNGEGTICVAERSLVVFHD